MRFLEHGGQLLVKLDGRDLGPGLRKALRQRADARSDLQHPVARLDFGSIDDTLYNAGIDEEVLAELLAHAQTKGLEDVRRYLTARDLGLQYLLVFCVHQIPSCFPACSSSSCAISAMARSNSSRLTP